MIVVRNSTSWLSAILGTQSVESNLEYRLISFCVLTEIDGNVVAYNSLTGEVLELDAREVAALREVVVEANDITKPLIEKWFLVPCDHNDILLSDEVRLFAKAFENNSHIKTYTIFTTMDCNARCFYCYELGRPRIPMSEDTAREVVEFIAANAPQGEEIRLNWFGGEPLSNSAVIDIITNGLRERNIPFVSHFTTNGFLMDEKTVQKAVDKWRIIGAQITLDGTEAVYNKVKAYVNSEGRSPFAVVTDNIERLLKRKVPVSIRMNLGEHNEEDLYNLVDWLSEKYKEYNSISVYPFLLCDTDFKKFNDIGREMLNAKKLVDLEEYCISKGVLKAEKLPKAICTCFCIADSPSAVTITPNGKLGKCEHFSENEFVGTLKEGITDKKKVSEFSERGNSQELCRGCSAYPICIRLKRCPDEGREICNEAKRFIKETQLVHSIRRTYRKFKEEQKNKAE